MAVYVFIKHSSKMTIVTLSQLLIMQNQALQSTVILLLFVSDVCRLYPVISYPTFGQHERKMQHFLQGS